MSDGHLLLDGSTGTRARANHAAHLNITGDLEVIACLERAVGGSGGLLTKFGSNAGYRITTGSDGAVQMGWGDGTDNHFWSSPADVITDSTPWWVRVRLIVDDDGDHTVTMWRSDDPPSTDPLSVSWGSPVTDISPPGTTSIDTNTESLTVGQRDSSFFEGKIFGVWIWDGLVADAGTLVAAPDWRTGDQGWDDPPGDDDLDNSWMLQGNAVWVPSSEGGLTRTVGSVVTGSLVDSV